MAIIIRHSSANRGGLSAATGEPWDYDVSISAEALSRRELSDIKKDPRTRHAVESICVRLVSPVSRSSTALPAGWGLKAIGCLNSPWTGEGTTVAVLDSGIDRAHAAFRGLDVSEEDFTGEGNGDKHGHGTHCAGTIFGRDVDSTRIGVAPGVRTALIYKIIDSCGCGSTESLAKAVVRATEQGAHIISMSVAFDFQATVTQLLEDGYPPALAPSMALSDYRENIGLFEGLSHYLERRIDGGPLVIAAAGNDSQRNLDTRFRVTAPPPADARGFIAVGAMEGSFRGRSKIYKVADFSNTDVDAIAPGVDILSARVGGGLTSMSGTSMATPQVAGAAALWRQALSSRFQKVRSKAVWAKITGSAVLTHDVELDDIGCGLVQCPQKSSRL